MAGHFPFGHKRGSRYGLAPRGTIAAFFELHGFGETQQESYYKWWYDWAKSYVENDSDLSATMGFKFSHYPMGTHAKHSFHLNGKHWAITLDELGSFISNLIFPKLSEEQMHKLADDHHHLIDELKQDLEANPRPASPDVGLYRHV
ncbi:MAG: hypothetical protein ACK4IT_08880 [Thioalkalivibrionaceae bacterium]